jgi:hypothetical protein
MLVVRRLCKVQLYFAAHNCHGRGTFDQGSFSRGIVAGLYSLVSANPKLGAQGSAGYADCTTRIAVRLIVC